jgi:molybdenum cofactor cytidylyltransferase
VLAAGLSTRMGGRNKLLLEVDGTTLVRRVAEVACAAGLDPVLVVVGRDAAEVKQELIGLSVECTVNDRPEDGMSSSIRAGLDALSVSAPQTTGAAMVLADMPWVRTEDIVKLVAAFEPAAGREICVPTHRGRRGNPVLWSARFFGEMKELHGDGGARALLELHAEAVHEVEASRGVLSDVDIPAHLASGQVREVS